MLEDTVTQGATDYMQVHWNALLTDLDEGSHQSDTPRMCQVTLNKPLQDETGERISSPSHEREGSMYKKHPRAGISRNLAHWRLLQSSLQIRMPIIECDVQEVKYLIKMILWQTTPFVLL